MASRTTKWLDQTGRLPFSAWCIVAAFSTYFCMYAFRKPFSAGTYEHEMLWGIGYKTVLIVSQTFGYMLSKFIGIKVISEMTPTRRALGIVVLIGFAHLSLLLFGLVPPPNNFVFLFLNGLPLGMVFGLVLSFLEGRQITEALAAGLCASFIVSSGVVKSVGRSLILYAGVNEYWMPFLSGLIFLPPLLFFVWMLSQIPPPHEEDVKQRAKRSPMLRADRKQFFANHAWGLSLLIVTYVLVTIMRSIRDDFAVEIWRDLGQSGMHGIFAYSETAVMLIVVAINGTAILIRDNRRALHTAMMAITAGLAVVAISIGCYSSGCLSSITFMIVAGAGMYVPYVTFNTTLFERMIAVFREKSNIGYLIYLADAMGYLGYVGVLLVRNFSQSSFHHLDFFLRSSLLICVISIVLMFLCMMHFRRTVGVADPVKDGVLEPSPQPHYQ